MGDPLWERLLIAATGPVVTAALALLVLNAVAGWAQRRRDASETRESLAAELTETANSLYLALQAFWRAARDIPLPERRDSAALTGHIKSLDDAYLAARSKGQVLEQRLKIYFAASEPSDLWHRVTDLLTVRYFLLLEGDADRRARIRRINSGPRHSGLSEDELNTPSTLLAAYREALAETIGALWRFDVDRRGKHLRGLGAVSTWHGGDAQPVGSVDS